MEKVNSTRGKQKIMYNGYVYIKQKNFADGVIGYECEKRRGSGAGLSQCKAKIKVKNEVVICTLFAHPLFPHEVWNINSPINNYLPRTNNSVEGFNRKMQSAVGACHPNLWRFLNVLKREYGLMNIVIDQSLGGHATETSRKKYRDSNARIYNIVADYGTDSLEFLRGIAQNLQF